ncbi:uncharacterized protein FPRN_05534 [Fusarium proliferatum]|nr:uncharacterized protein FPRN_05534 [Fusarium proliferatum]
MPVTVTIPNSKASSWQHPKVENTSQLLRGASSQEADGCKQIIQSSFSINGSLEENHVSASRNGLVWSSFYAYSTHHHLTIRPEDVWFAIITQLSAYINANSERMRDYFVSHAGQKRLEVIDFATLHTADYGALSQKMTLEIAKNIKDPAFREWILPSFSTTTDNDRVVGSVLLMGALQKLDKLDEMGEEPIQFAKLLRPILRNMILSFTQPSDPAIHIFWNQIANIYRMSGSKKLTGWITAFCYWDDEGKAGHPSRGNGTLGDLMYLRVETSDIPCGYVTVPVEVDDNGTVYDCKMIAGSVGMQAVPGPEGHVPAYENRGHNEEVDETRLGIKPVTGWMIYEFAQQSRSYNRGPLQMYTV